VGWLSATRATDLHLFGISQPRHCQVGHRGHPWGQEEERQWVRLSPASRGAWLCVVCWRKWDRIATGLTQGLCNVVKGITKRISRISTGISTGIATACAKLVTTDSTWAQEEEQQWVL
jgi:hypothetical protein